ncbi:MAG TPA: hypothetical protein VE344_05800 [Methylomirabilota bacterium]|nr:hypothetical protein [Methylomirabilota bacterium]
MKKIILWSVVGILIAGIAVAVFLWLTKPQVIQLDKNTKLTLLGVEYGKHHKFPKVKTKVGHTSGGPTSFDTTNDTLVVWILQEHKGNQGYGWQTLVYDHAETACVQSWARQWNQVGMNKQIAAVQLDAFPRRDSKFILRFQSWGNGGQHVSKDGFVISNPVRGKTFSKWMPDSLPNTQSDGDFTVTLNKLIANAPSPYNRGGNLLKNDPANKSVQVDFDVQQNGHVATNWNPVQVETSDATGNDIRGWINNFRQNGDTPGYFYQPGLWPNESAWKVRLEFSRTSGFNDDELWSVTNIPVRAGSQQDAQIFLGDPNSNKAKTPFAETTLNGIHVKLYSATQYTDQNEFPGGNSKVVSITIKTDPNPETNSMRMSPLSVTDDQGRALNNRGASWGGGNYQYQFAEPRNIQSVNVTIALHKSRFVEFTVKPTKQ